MYGEGKGTEGEVDSEEGYGGRMGRWHAIGFLKLLGASRSWLTNESLQDFCWWGALSSGQNFEIERHT